MESVILFKVMQEESSGNRYGMLSTRNCSSRSKFFRPPSYSQISTAMPILADSHSQPFHTGDKFVLYLAQFCSHVDQQTAFAFRRRHVAALQLLVNRLLEVVFLLGVTRHLHHLNTHNDRQMDMKPGDGAT